MHHTHLKQLLPSVFLLFLFSAILPSHVYSTRTRRNSVRSRTDFNTVNSQSFSGAACDDSEEFQTLFKNEAVCESPTMILVDRLDPTNMFVQCMPSLLRLQTMAVSNQSGSASMGQYVQVIPQSVTSIVQLTNSAGDILLAYDSYFYLTDRLVVSPLRSFPAPEGFSVVSMAVDQPISTRNDLSSNNQQEEGFVYFIADAKSVPYYKRQVIRLQINHQNPNQSIFESLLPITYANQLLPGFLHVQPKLHLLHIVSNTVVLECDLLSRSTRILFNLSGMNVPSASASISNVVMNDAVASGDSLDAIFIGLSFEFASSSTPFVYRVLRSTLTWDVFATTATCLDAQLSSLTYSSIDQTLFISCASRFVVAASFNGSIADPSSSVTFQPITNQLTCDPSFVARIEDATYVGSNVAQLVIACKEESTIITTIGASLSHTISYTLCSFPTVVSSQLDEFGRQILLHTCGSDFQFPIVVVDGIPKVLTSLCGSANPLLHRAGTSQVIARCVQSDSVYIVSVNTDNSNPQRLFDCPTHASIDSQSNNLGWTPSTTPSAAISDNSTLIILCGTHNVWTLPLYPQTGNGKLLWSLPDSSSSISGILASSHFAFLSVLPDVFVCYAINLQSGAVNTIQGNEIIIDEPNNAIWTQLCTGDFYNGDQCLIFRQQPIDDFSPAATQIFLNSTSAPRAWLVDAVTNSLIVVLNNAQLFRVPAYNITGEMAQAATIVLPVMPTCTFEDPYDQILQLTIHRRLGLLLLECDPRSSPDWVIVGLPLQFLSNANTTTTTTTTKVRWLPVLRSTPDCDDLRGPFVIGAQESGLYVSCGISSHLSLNFQCAPGMAWSAGGCVECISGWSKSAAAAEVSPYSLVIPQCNQCSPGSIAISPGSFECLPCAVGTYHDSSLGEVCRPCPTGSYQNISGASQCIPCEVEAGLYAPSQGSASCSRCTLGSLPDPLGVTCIACPRDSYAPSTTSFECTSCESTHQSGLDCSNGLASVREGYFAFLVDESDVSILLPSAASEGIGVFYSAACPYGFCPGSPLQSSSLSNWSSLAADNCRADDPQAGPIHYCCWPRLNSPQNLLCASCVDGYIAWSSRCVSCSGANGGLISLVIIFSIALIAWLYSNAADTSTDNHSSTSGHVAILLYFIQICSLQMGHVSDWLQWIHWSNLSASSTSGCIAPLDPYQQAAFNLAVPLLLTGIMLFIASLHWMYDRCTRKAVRDAELDVHRSVSFPADQLSDLQHPFISIDSRSRDNMRDFVNAAESEELDVHAIQSASISRSSTIPDQRVDSTDAFFSLWSPLSGCYSSSVWYWNAFVLARRVSFSACAVFLANTTESRFPVFTLMHFFSLLTHQYATPYRLQILNSIDTWSHSVLLVVSVLLSLQSPPYPVWFEVVIVLAVTLIVVCMIGWTAWIKLQALFTRKSQPESVEPQAESRCTRLLRTIFTPTSFSVHRYFRTFLLVMLFCYTSVTSTVLSFLHCVDVSSDVRLVFDTPTIDCRSDRYHTYRIWVIMVLLVYTIGFPVGSLILLAWRRKVKV